MRMANGEIKQEWDCPKCKHHQTEWFEDDHDYEMTFNIMCEDCGEWFNIDDLPEFHQ